MNPVSMIDWVRKIDLGENREFAVPLINLPVPISTVEVSGPMTRDQVVRWHGVFTSVLAQGSLRIDLAASGPWDLAGVQLLLAAIASGRKSGHPTVLARIPRVLEAIAGRAGLRDGLEAAVEN